MEADRPDAGLTDPGTPEKNRTGSETTSETGKRPGISGTDGSVSSSVGGYRPITGVALSAAGSFS